MDKRFPRASEEDLCALFRRINLRLDQVCLVDGFDECTKGEANLTRIPDALDAREKFLEELKEAIARAGARVPFTNRENADTRKSYRLNLQFPNSSPFVHWLECEILREDIKVDIRMCAEHVVEQDFHKKSNEVKEEIATLLVEKCAGM